MAVTTDLAFFTGATGGSSAADAITDWTGTGIAVDTVQFIQGTGSIYSYSSPSTTSRTWTFACTSTNITNKVIYFWFSLGKVGWLNTKANGGLKLRVYDASGAYGGWFIAGSDTLPHNGFICHAVHTSVSFDETSGTVDKTAVTKVEVIALGSFPGKAYAWVDAIRYGTYLQIDGGTASSPTTFSDFKTAEETTANRYGILSYVDGVYFVQGILKFGSTTAGTATYFKDTSQIIVFKDVNVPSTYFEMILQGNSTATTQIFFGTKSGDSGISGCFFSSAGAAKYKVTATDTNLTDLGFYGCTFLDADTISLPAYSATHTREVLNTNFEKCAEVLADTCIVKNCSFISADLRGIRMSSTSHNITNSKFIGCPRGINIPNAGTYTFDALTFSGNTYDIENSSAGLVTINCTNGANPSTYTNTGGGTTSIQNAVNVLVKCIDKNNNPLSGIRVYIERASDKSQILNDTTNASGEVSTSYNYTADTLININIRRSPTGGTRYLPYNTTGVITTSGFNLTVVLYQDSIAS